MNSLIPPIPPPHLTLLFDILDDVDFEGGGIVYSNVSFPFYTPTMTSG